MKIGDRVVAGVVMGLLAGPALAQSDESSSPFYSGAYVAPMATWLHTTKGNTDDGWGGTFAIGNRDGNFAYEIQFAYTRPSVSDPGTGSVNATSGGIFGLYFPFTALPNLYGTAGVGLLNLERYPGNGVYTDISTPMLLAGIGHLWRIGGEHYDFGIRTEVLYRYAQTPDSAQHREGVPDTLGDVIVNLGLYLPIGTKKPVEEKPAEAVAVVAPVAPVDSDGDGVTDDLDRCPDTPAGTKVDAQGCPLASPPCKAPEAGQLADLSGCAVGTSMVLRGVNFDYDKATLTLNARAVLDGVAGALQSAPDVQIEIGGHTDSRGSDSYNERLSEQRANSVMQYLSTQGVAASRMTAKGYGETQPIADNNTDEGRELNRRVELKIVGAGAAAAPAATTDAATTDAPQQ